MRSELSCLYHLGSGALERADLTEAAVHIDAMARLAAEFDLAPHLAFSLAQRAELHLRAGQWQAAAREAAAASVVFLAVGVVRNEIAHPHLRGRRAVAKRPGWRSRGDVGTNSSGLERPG